MQTAQIHNIGPIEHLTIPVPEDGGVVVFKGANGVGKSISLDAVEKVVTGRGDRLPIRDGQVKGKIEGWGVKLTIGKSTARSGEATVHSLEGRLDVGQLVDPGIKEPERADAKRIRALVTMLGARPDPAMFYETLGGKEEFDRIVDPASLTHDDLVSLAEAIKRDIDAEARQAEGEAKNARGRAEAARKAAEGIDIEDQSDARPLQATLEDAVRTKERLQNQQQAHATATANAKMAGDALDARMAKYTGPTSEQAKQEELKIAEDMDAASKEIMAAQEALKAAKQKWEQLVIAKSNALNVRQLADQHAETVAAYRQTIDRAASLEAVNPGDVVRADSAVVEARKRVENAAIVRRAQEQTREAERFEATADGHETDAKRWRDAAKAVEDVLSEVVAKSGVPLRVEARDARMRLTTETARGRTCFGDLSDGERWKLGLKIAITAVGRGGELTIGQQAYESLDPTNRREIAEEARAAGVLIYTAESTDGPLRAEVYS